MYAIQRLDLGSLDDVQRATWAPLALFDSLPILHNQHPDDLPDTTLIAIGALAHNHPVGLLLASYLPASRTAQVHSLMITSPHRNQRLATQLLQQLEKELEALNYLFVTMYYEVEDPSAPALEKVIKRLGWRPPKLVLLHCHFDKGFNAPWLQRHYPLPKGMTEFFWSDLTAQERLILTLQEDQRRFHFHVSPFRQEKLIENANSLGLRYRGEVVGWVITHRVAPDKLYYAALYVDKAFQGYGPAVRLLRDAIKLTIASPDIQRATLDINLIEADPQWLTFLKRRLIPYASAVTHTYETWTKSASNAND